MLITVFVHDITAELGPTVLKMMVIRCQVLAKLKLHVSILVDAASGKVN